MRRLQPYPIAIALTFIAFVLYLVCTVVHGLAPDVMKDSWPMHRLWVAVLPGFTWITPASFVLGLVELFLLSFYTAYTAVPLYSFFLVRSHPGVAGDETMRPLLFQPVALALGSFGLLTYVLCTLFDLIFPAWSMAPVWEVLLPGYTAGSWLGFLVGLVGVAAYAAYTSALLVLLYNYFARVRMPKTD